jgi:hypothetical protein
MTKTSGPTALTGKLDLALPDGSVMRVQPGPYGKGISVTPLTRAAAGHSGKGRPPHPSTLALRERMARDKAAGRLRSASEYVAWVSSQDPKAPRAGLQQTVYRELRVAGGAKGRRRKAGGGARGRAPNPATLALRERLAKDRETGLKERAFYVRWLVEKADLGLKKARPIVYRELRAQA